MFYFQDYLHMYMVRRIKFPDIFPKINRDDGIQIIFFI